ncbi:hypothetical protein VNO78_05502 [Psophocarpus tetragonolobus]|uniref:Uncharacterized protein n=1 Tax=Psophocarpus tetragonolobus TaxID=3891 RepID=A0AAN9SRV4_PSOTE
MMACEDLFLFRRGQFYLFIFYLVYLLTWFSLSRCCDLCCPKGNAATNQPIVLYAWCNGVMEVGGGAVELGLCVRL